MKRVNINDIYDVARAVYCAGYAVKVVSFALLNELFHFNKKDMLDLPIRIGDMVETDKYDMVPASDTPLGATVRMIEASRGWVVDIYTDKNRPGSIIIYRVLFPDCVFWVTHCWVRKK